MAATDAGRKAAVGSKADTALKAGVRRKSDAGRIPDIQRTSDRAGYPDIRSELEALADEPYRLFQSRLLPGTGHPILGVRVPLLWKLARRLTREEGDGYLRRASDETYEEVMLQGMVLCLLKEELGEKLRRLPSYLAKIDNWAECDIICSGLKAVKDGRDQTFSFLEPYLHSDREYEVRFAVVLLLNYYIDETYVGKTLSCLKQVCHPGYYVKMAVAWALSVCYVEFPDRTLSCLKEGPFDDFTYNKALQKITESYQIDKETKKIIRSMKR